MNMKKCSFGLDLLSVVLLVCLMILIQTSLVALFVGKYGLAYFAYDRIISKVLITTIIMVPLATYYKARVSFEGLKYTPWAQSCIEWNHITQVYKKRILFYDVIYIVGNGKKVYIPLLSNYLIQLKLCVLNCSNTNLLVEYLEKLTDKDIQKITRHYKMFLLSGFLAGFLLVFIPLYQHVVWYPAKLIETLESVVERHNQSIPKQVDQYTTLEKLVFLKESKKLQYYYTLNLSLDDEDLFVSLMKTELSKTHCENQKVVKYLKIGMVYEHFYTISCDSNPIVKKITIDNRFCSNELITDFHI